MDAFPEMDAGNGLDGRDVAGWGLSITFHAGGRISGMGTTGPGGATVCTRSGLENPRT